MTTDVKVIADSISLENVRLTTLQLKYWRGIHSEVMTHRVFSRNASSSRAIPIKRMLADIWSDPAMPIFWGANESGMQANNELQGFKYWLAKKLWITAGRVACIFSYAMHLIGLHKQIGNRITEPWQHIHVVLSSTEWDNFFELRDHADAQPEIRELALMMHQEMITSAPIERSGPPKETQSWHLPYISAQERETFSVRELCAMSTARCARVSYLTHDKKAPNWENDIKLHDRLVGSVPIHASPTEHIAYPAKNGSTYFGNFRGWKQYRKQLEAGFAAKAEGSKLANEICDDITKASKLYREGVNR